MTEAALPRNPPVGLLTTPPLALYVHLPWCVRKCPYCDFNSYRLGPAPPFGTYVARLLEDLDQELSAPAARRPLVSLFIGGGTPSLFPGQSIRTLLDGIRDRMDLAGDCEITLEANPGAADAARFAAYRRAGVNRLSIGVQSLDSDMLRRLGRIHDPAAARSAVVAARQAGFDNLNLDLMFALPDQTLTAAATDLEALLALGPDQVSYYQLTLEPETPFQAAPPNLPNGDLAADMAAAGCERLARAGFEQYEVSAHARPGRQCQHNLNYWRFGDYLGIGAGAHGKLTEVRAGAIRRHAKHSDPETYLASSANRLVHSARELNPDERVSEFALNAFRLTGGFELGLFESRTGLPWGRMAPVMAQAVTDGLVRIEGGSVCPTPLGQAFADDLVARFLDT